jgi:DnaJ domain
MSSKPPIALPDTDDPYVLLDVRPGASAEQIRRAYLRRVKEWKPDRHPAEFRRVREAYDRLREQERWFDAWRQASDVVRRAAEQVARGDDEPPVGADGPPSAATDDGPGIASDAGDEGNEADEDVAALIAALEDELRDHREPADDDPPPAHDAAASEPRRRGAHAAELASRNRERLAVLEHAVHAALDAGRWAEAADRLLEPDAEALATYREFAPLLLEVCCAVVWELPPRFAVLVARYGDLVSTLDTEHRDGALLHRRTLVDELPAWRRAVADCPELHRFLVLGSSLRAPAEAELGLRLGQRAAADPTAFFRVLTGAAQVAPGFVSLYVGMAERWSRCYGRLALDRPARVRPTVEQAAAALADVAQRHPRVRWEQAVPLLASLAMVLVALLARSPVIELAVIGLALVLWAWRAWAADPAARIYTQALRPAAATWLWATQGTLDELATALRARLPPPGTWGAVLHPGDLGQYPGRLRDDLALLAFSVTAPMIPRLRAPRL